MTDHPDLTVEQSPVAQASQQYALCPECGAPVEQSQRYCVSCGAHQLNGHDPAAEYLSQASSARSRVAAALALRAGGGRRRAPGLLAALVIAVVPVSVAVGVTIGRDAGGGDAKLVQALDRLQAAGGGSGVESGAGPSGTRSGSQAGQHSGKRAKAGRSKSASASSTPAKAVQESPASVQQISGATGSNYNGQENQLPSVVAVP